MWIIIILEILLWPKDGHPGGLALLILFTILFWDDIKKG